MDRSLLEVIRFVASAVSGDELTKLRVEEELLTLLIRRPDQQLNLKKEAIEKLKLINARQLNMLSGKSA